MIRELRQYFEFRAEDKISDSAQIAGLLGSHSLWQVVRRFNLANLLGKKRAGWVLAN